MDRRRLGDVRPRPKDLLGTEEYRFQIRDFLPVERILGTEGAKAHFRAVKDFEAAWGKAQQAAWEQLRTQWGREQCRQGSSR